MNPMAAEPRQSSKDPSQSGRGPRRGVSAGRGVRVTGPSAPPAIRHKLLPTPARRRGGGGRAGVWGGQEVATRYFLPVQTHSFPQSRGCRFSFCLPSLLPPLCPAHPSELRHFRQRGPSTKRAESGFVASVPATPVGINGR